MQRKKGKHGGRSKILFKPRSEGQRRYVESIENNTVTLCAGYAGTGKTLCAIATAIGLCQNPTTPYRRIILVRPAVEACGERIGYLPGGINDKMRPLVQPIIDAMRVLTDDESFINELIDGHSIHGPGMEIVPMAFMRGRTFSNAIVLLDEAQNASPAQIKLFLTRIGENCKVIIEGDPTQSDIYDDRDKTGLMDAIRRIGSLDDVGVVTLEVSDIQRNPILESILKRYGDVKGT
jgi:phosphate starvation-inducible PhoH-like protein